MLRFYLFLIKMCSQLQKTLASPLDNKDIKLVNPKGNQPWIFFRRTDAEVPILWPPDVKNQLIGKEPDAGEDGVLEEKGATEVEMVGWHHQINGHEFEWTLGDGDGQRSLVLQSTGLQSWTWPSDWTTITQSFWSLWDRNWVSLILEIAKVDYLKFLHQLYKSPSIFDLAVCSVTARRWFDLCALPSGLLSCLSELYQSSCFVSVSAYWWWCCLLGMPEALSGPSQMFPRPEPMLWLDWTLWFLLWLQDAP